VVTTVRADRIADGRADQAADQCTAAATALAADGGAEDGTCRGLEVEDTVTAAPSTITPRIRLWLNMLFLPLARWTGTGREPFGMGSTLAGWQGTSSAHTEYYKPN
jgi:hypothetical protein